MVEPGQSASLLEKILQTVLEVRLSGIQPNPVVSIPVGRAIPRYILLDSDLSPNRGIPRNIGYSAAPSTEDLANLVTALLKP